MWFTFINFVRLVWIARWQANAPSLKSVLESNQFSDFHLLFDLFNLFLSVGPQSQKVWVGKVIFFNMPDCTKDCTHWPFIDLSSERSLTETPSPLIRCSAHCYPCNFINAECSIIKLIFLPCDVNMKALCMRSCPQYSQERCSKQTDHGFKSVLQSGLDALPKRCS